MRELNKFIFATESFADKYILFLRIGEKGIKEKKILKNSDNFLCSNLIHNFIIKLWILLLNLIIFLMVSMLLS